MVQFHILPLPVIPALLIPLTRSCRQTKRETFLKEAIQRSCFFRKIRKGHRKHKEAESSVKYFTHDMDEDGTFSVLGKLIEKQRAA